MKNLLEYTLIVVFSVGAFLWGGFSAMDWQKQQMYKACIHQHVTLSVLEAEQKCVWVKEVK